MTIKQQGGIFGRNPTFNDVDIEGTLTVNGEPISDFGSMAQQDADSVNIDGGSIDGVTIGTNSPVTDFYAGDLRIDNYIIRSTSSNDVAVVPDSTGIFDVVANSKIRKPNYQDTTLEIANGPATVGNKREILFTDQSGTTAYIRAYGSSYGSGLNNVMRFGSGSGSVDLTPSGNLAFASGQGIDFSATSGTGTSELFDDYEEGSFTASLKVGGTTLYSTTTTRYTKVGRLVYYNIDFTSNSYPGVGANTGNVTVSGLPYAATNTVGRAVTSNVLQVSSPFTANLQDIGTNINATSSEVTFYSTTGTTSSTLTHSALSASASSSTYLRLSGVYTAA